MPEFHRISIRADFAEGVVYSWSGGYNEMEVAGACTSLTIAASVKRKIDEALDACRPNQRDITLRLTDDEAMAFGVAASNCATGGLPSSQSAVIAQWYERWKQSPWAAFEDDSLVVAQINAMIWMGEEVPSA